MYPTGTVSIVLKGVTKTPTIAANGTFSAVFSTGGIEDGTYTITFKYTSTDPNFNSAPNATSTLKITEH